MTRRTRAPGAGSDDPLPAGFPAAAGKLVHDLANAVQADERPRIRATAEALHRLAAAAAEPQVQTIADEIIGAVSGANDPGYALYAIIRRLQAEVQRLRAGS